MLNVRIGKGNVFNIVTAVKSADRGLDFDEAAGAGDPQTGAVMAPDTPYFIVGVTKMFTAAIVMRLYQEKRIDLEAPVTKNLPESLILRHPCVVRRTNKKPEYIVLWSSFSSGGRTRTYNLRFLYRLPRPG